MRLTVALLAVAGLIGCSGTAPAPPAAKPGVLSYAEAAGAAPRNVEKAAPPVDAATPSAPANVKSRTPKLRVEAPVPSAPSPAGTAAPPDVGVSARVLFVVDAPGIEVRVGSRTVGQTVPLADLRRGWNGGNAAALDDAIADAQLPQSAAGILVDATVAKPLFISFRGPCLVDAFRAVTIQREQIDVTGRSPIVWLGGASIVRMQRTTGTAGCGPASAAIYQR